MGGVSLKLHRISMQVVSQQEENTHIYTQGESAREREKRESLLVSVKLNIQTNDSRTSTKIGMK